MSYCENEKIIECLITDINVHVVKKKFTVKVGTIFENSKLPLQKWFIALFFIINNEKGVSSVQLAKELGITQKRLGL